MKILHTSDFHIGKRLAERERLPEQIEALKEIAEICEREGVSLVLIAGDIFDTYTPPSQAEEVFFDSLEKIAGDSRAVVIISGNHDDGVRLSACTPLAEERGIYLFGGTPRVFKKNIARPVRAVESGENWIVISNEEGEKVYINALPYPNEAHLKEEKSEEGYAEKISRLIRRGEEGYRGDMPHILLSHLFVVGGSVSDGERNIDLGGARALPLSVFPKDGYVALGHLHKRQSFGNLRYSGSLLQYSFDETPEKSVVLLETDGLNFKQREIPLHAGKRLVNLECETLSAALELLPSYADSYVHLKLHLKQPLSVSETESLKQAAGGAIVSLETLLPETVYLPEKKRAAMNSADLFREYYRSLFEEEPSKALLDTFLELSSEEQ